MKKVNNKIMNKIIDIYTLNIYFLAKMEKSQEMKMTAKPGRKAGVKFVSPEKEAIARSVTLPREDWERADREAENAGISRGMYFKRILHEYWGKKLS